MKSGYQQHFSKLKQTAQAQRSTIKKSPKVAISPPKRKSSKIHFGKIFASLAGLVIAGLGLIYADDLETFVTKVEIHWLGSANASEAEAKPNVEKAKPEDDKIQKESRETPVVDVDHLAKLSERSAQLDAREQEIGRQEQELGQMKADLEKRLKELNEMREQISSILADRLKADDGKVEGLVQMYSNMKPPQASKVFETMDEDLAVQILTRMKRKNAAEIMNLLPPAKAQLFTERYAGYKK